jgi:hypothetical protein
MIAYDPEADEWSDLDRLPGVRQAAVGQVIGDDIFISTGSSSGVNPQTTTWRLDASDLFD